ncbi:MAG TPA: rhamnulokinase family protein [Abditibacteriaceae bacterium]|jgi:rhamnulokinase
MNLKATQKYAAVDLGAESGRVLVGSFDGEKLTLDEAHRFANTSVRINHARGETLHWDVLRLWNDIQDGLGKAAHSGELSGIGVDTWGVDFGLLDAEDQLIGNPVHYRDARTDGMMEAAFELVPRSEIFASTGLQFMQLNTLFQLMALKNSPQLEAAKTLLLMPDLLNFWLTGEKASEYTIASTTQILNAQARAWDENLLAKLGLPSHFLTSIQPAGTQRGTVRESLAGRIGARGTAVYAPGCHDTASAVAAVPANEGNWAYLSSGTWSLMGLELVQPLINEQVAHYNFTNEGGVGNSIRFLKNIAGLWLVQECRRAWAREGHDYSYAELTEEAAGQAGGTSFIDPDANDFLAPDSMPEAIAEYCRKTGQIPPESVGATIRCCLESLALKYRWVLERLEELSGQKIEVLHIVGGGTQNKLLSRLTADCLGRVVIAGPIEATATGNILTQAMARGELKNLTEIRQIVRASFPLETFEPKPTSRAAWDAAYEKFLRLSA